MTEKAAGEKQSAGRLARLADAVGDARRRGAAPVERWNPPFCGEIALRIAADGTWFYEGTPIRRPALVSLFASVLRKDLDRYVLVTPVERVGIEVEDVPFVAVAMRRDGDTLAFVTSLGDEVEVGAAHGLRFETAADGGVRPYVHIRGELWARLTRSLAIELLEQAAAEDQASQETANGATIGIRAAGRFFPIAATEVSD